MIIIIVTLMVGACIGYGLACIMVISGKNND